MSKFLKNTTGVDIVITSVGLTISASTTLTIEVEEYTLWASDDVIAEITTDINTGDLVVSDGIGDLSAFDGLNFLRYPDTAFNIRFLSDPERFNGFIAKNVQEAIEEAVTGTSVVTPTTTVDATPTVAFSQTLADDTAYEFDARVIARGLSTVLAGDFQQVVTVRRESGGGAAIVSAIFQKRANRENAAAGTEICWDVSGNAVQLKVTGLAATTIKWQPQVEFEKVS